jgi:hypothetical protein
MVSVSRAWAALAAINYYLFNARTLSKREELMNKKENKKELLDEVRRIANSLEPAALWLLDHPCGFGKTKWSDNSCTSAEDMAAWMVSVPDDLREAVAFLEPAAKSLLDPLMMTNALMIVMESGITDINRKLSKSER